VLINDLCETQLADILAAILQSASVSKCYLPHFNTMLDFDFLWKSIVHQGRNGSKSSLLKILIQHIAEPVQAAGTLLISLFECQEVQSA